MIYCLNRMIARPAQSGFSLVELSIALVILGLLTGGILAGQSLIRASELRAVSTEYNRYVTATQTFRDKYFALPGDMANAESFWQSSAIAAADCRVTAAVGTATCNGDGDGNIEMLSARSMESFRFWQQLTNAGMIEGTYTGIPTSDGMWGGALGTNLPRSKLRYAGWAVITGADTVLYSGWYLNAFPPANSNNWLELGSIVGVNGLVIDPLLKPEEAWNIDSKLDDGRPGTGNVTTFNNTQHSTCASSNTAANATYQLGGSSSACTMLMGL